MRRTATCNFNELEVIDELKSGNSIHFRDLYEHHSRRVFSLCLRMVRSRELAEDLTQETFMAVFRKIGTFRGESAFSTWLHRLAVNVVFMHLRQQKSRISEVHYEEVSPEDDTPIDTHGEIDRVLAGADMRIALMRAIDQLPAGYRLVFVLHDIEGYEHREIAELLGCSAGNTKSQLHKARMKLRKLLIDKPVLQSARARRELRDQQRVFPCCMTNRTGWPCIGVNRSARGMSSPFGRVSTTALSE
jgi:RNA polymerase sigma-70 factor (ECF subfamily)